MQQASIYDQAPQKSLHCKKERNKCNKWKANIADYIWCQPCKVYLQNSDDMQEHKKRMDHTLNTDFQEVVKRDNLTDVKQQDHKNSRHKKEFKIRESKTVQLKYNIENLWFEINEAEGTKGANFVYAGTDLFVCRPCHISVHVTEISKHVHGLEHQEAINMDININSNRKVIREEEQLWERLHHAFRTHQKYIRIQDERHMFCFLCEKCVPAVNTHNLLAHVSGKNHMKNVIIYLQTLYSVLKGVCLNPDIQSLLTLSNSECKETKIYQRMIEPTDDRHLINLHSLLNKINAADNKTFCQVTYTCLLCDQVFDSGSHWLNHMNEISHKQKVETLSKTGKRIGKYICCVCNVIMCGNESDHHCVDAEDGPVVSRVLVSGYGKEGNLESLYDALQPYGTVTNCALTNFEAIFEFQEREAVRNILKDRVNFQGNVLSIQPLTFKEVQDIPEPVQVNQCLYSIFSSMENFNCKINSICEIIDSASNQTSDQYLARFLERELSKAFNTRVRTYLFGSRVSGIAFQDSDVDVFADTGNMYRGNHGQEVSVQDNIVGITAKALQAHPDCECVIAVPKARTPIVKFKYKPTSTYCDIAFRHGLGCENTKLIRFYLSLDPSIKPLLGFLKFWMQLHELYGPRRLTSYAIVWLVIFFLQQLPDVYFPTVEELQKDMPLKIIAGWNCSFNGDRSTLPFRRIPHSLLQLVNEFFKFYHEFDFVKFVICPLTGLPEPKIFFKKNISNLPDSMKVYVQRSYSCHGEKLSLTPVCIQDPFELSHNISKSAPCETVKRFQTCCSLSAELYTKLEHGRDTFES